MAGVTGSSVDLALRPRLVIVTLIFLIFLINAALAEEILLTINVKKPLYVTSDSFLSYTLDPTTVLTGDVLTKNPQKSINMAKALSPAYVRIGGPRSNSYTFVRSQNSPNEEDVNFTITETNWINLHRWAENAGLKVVTCIAPQHTEIGDGDFVWDSRNTLDLISFSDQMGFNTSWQLGYECQTRCDINGVEMGKAVQQLRGILNAFPRYSKSHVTGPDVVTYRTKQQQQYLQDYFNIGGISLSAITWHPHLAGVSFDVEGVSMHNDNLATEKDGLYRLIGRSISRKSLWLAESKREKCKNQFLGALVWTRRLGNAAKIGIQVIMRQPEDSNLLQPTPDYWVSVLHKNLVGREVLDTRINTGNRSHVYFFCQCTRPSSKYEKGSLTIFGINLTAKKISINLKSLKITSVHKYILMPGFDAQNRMFSKTILLNSAPLNLVNDRELPEIKPIILTNKRGITLRLPSGGIGFWVLPGLKIKACGSFENNGDKMLLRKLSKRLEASESEEDFIEENGSDGQENSSTENRRYLTLSNKIKKRTKNRNSDDRTRPYGRIEARMDLERLERIILRNDNEEKSSSRVRNIYMDLENGKRLDGEELDEETSRDIKRKLVEYKKRLDGYEDRKGKIESTEDMIESEKVIEAMNLISKMEKAIRRSKSSFDDLEINEAGLSSRQENSDDNYDAFLDKLLESKKIKRSSVPTKIEDQLRAIYRMLDDEKQRRRGNSVRIRTNDTQENEKSLLKNRRTILSRSRRDSDKKFDVDPLAPRKDRDFRRPSRFVEEIRERRNRRKDSQDRINIHSVTFDPKNFADSEEDDFYGFPRQRPMVNFPRGDVHLIMDETTQITRHNFNKNFDTSKNTKFKMNSDANRKSRVNIDEGIIKGKNDFNHESAKYFETTKSLTRLQNYETTDDYKELAEIESINQNIDDNFQVDETPTIKRIIEQNHNDREEKRAREWTIKSLLDYHQKPKILKDEIAEHKNTEIKSGKNFSNRKLVENSTPQKNVRQMNFRTSTDVDVVAVSSDEEQALTNYDFDRSKRDENLRRKKRFLVEFLDEEMISQDENNLKDCNRRFPRVPEKNKVIGKKNKRMCFSKKNVKIRERGRDEKKYKNRRNPASVQNLDTYPMRVTIDVNKRMKRDLKVFEEKKTELTNEPQTIQDDKNFGDSNENFEDDSEQDLTKDLNRNEKKEELNDDIEKPNSFLNEGMSNTPNVSKITTNDKQRQIEEDVEKSTTRKTINDETVEINTTKIVLQNKEKARKNTDGFLVNEKLTNESINTETKPEQKPTMANKFSIYEEMSNGSSEIDRVSVSNVVKRENVNETENQDTSPKNDEETENSATSPRVRSDITEKPKKQFRRRKNKKFVEKTIKNSGAQIEETESDDGDIVGDIRNENADVSIRSVPKVLGEKKEKTKQSRLLDTALTTELPTTVSLDFPLCQTTEEVKNENPVATERKRSKILKKLTKRSRYRATNSTTEFPPTVDSNIAVHKSIRQVEDKSLKAVESTTVMDKLMTTRTNLLQTVSTTTELPNTVTSDSPVRQLISKIMNKISSVKEEPILKGRKEIKTKEDRVRDNKLTSELPSTVTPSTIISKILEQVMTKVSNVQSNETSIKEEKEAKREVTTRKSRFRASRTTELPSTTRDPEKQKKMKVSSKSKRKILKKTKLRSVSEATTMSASVENEPMEKLVNVSQEKNQVNTLKKKLRKRQEKLRQDQDKLVSSYRDELLKDLEGGSDESKSLYRREIIETLLNDKNIKNMMGKEIQKFLQTIINAKKSAELLIPAIIAIIRLLETNIKEKLFSQDKSQDLPDFQEFSDHKITRRHGNFLGNIFDIPENVFSEEEEISSKEEISDEELSEEKRLNLAEETNYYKRQKNDYKNSYVNNLHNLPLELNAQYANSKYNSLALYKKDKSSEEQDSKNIWTPIIVSGVEALINMLLKKLGVRNDIKSKPSFLKPTQETNSFGTDEIEGIDIRDLLDPTKYKLMMLVDPNENKTPMRSRGKRHLESNDLKTVEENSTPTKNNEFQKINTIKVVDETAKKNEIYSSSSNLDKMNLDQDKILNIPGEKKYDEKFVPLSFESQKGDDLNNFNNFSNEYFFEKDSQLAPDVTANAEAKIKDDDSLPSLIEKAVPKLKDSVDDSIKKVRKISESFEKFIDEFDEKLNEEQIIKNETSKVNSVDDSTSISSTIFDDALTNAKRVFKFLSGLVQIFRNNVY